MEFLPTQINDVLLVEPKVFGDHRGFFLETWQARRFKEAGIQDDFVQDNQSMSLHNVLRGLHYQIRVPQGKLVRIIEGTVFDVAVDLRRSSPTFGRWSGVTLSAETMRMLWIPPGFAHGFYVLSERAQIVYKCTQYYAPEHERTLRWNDPDLGIAWPIPKDVQPVLSDKDAGGVFFKDAEVYEGEQDDRLAASGKMKNREA
ncbi:MAG: dTDP-4-dehydrorhamnose 3,5-epimerase [Desulfovibrionales bacterium]